MRSLLTILFVNKKLFLEIVVDCMPLVLSRENSCIPIICLIVEIWVEYGPVVFPPTSGRHSTHNMACLCVCDFGLYCALFNCFLTGSHKMGEIISTV